MSGRGNVETLLVLQLQPIEVDTNSPDRDGMLVIANGLLTAVLVRLAEPEHDDVGSWFFEVGFGRLQGKKAPTFPSLEEATRWLRRHLKAA